MSVREEKSWSLHCDWPDCGHQFEYGDYSIFGDGYDPAEIVYESDGWTHENGRLHYCHRHPTVWESDLDDKHERPFLLIVETDDYPQARVRLMEAS